MSQQYLGVGSVAGRLIVTDTEIQINGMAHVILYVSDFGAARKFYERLLPALGMIRSAIPTSCSIV
jgi:hypothetical protein